MVAGADSIEDMDLLRHGGMDRLFAGVRACFGAAHRAWLDAQTPEFRTGAAGHAGPGAAAVLTASGVLVVGDR